MHAYRLANRLDVRERRTNAAVADELRGEAAKQGLALVGRTAEVVNLVAVALRAGKRRQPATRQLRRSEISSRPGKHRADGWTLEAFSGSVPRQHAPSSRSPWSASTQQQQRQAGSAQAARRPKPDRPSPVQEVDVTLSHWSSGKTKGRKLAASPDLPMTVNPFTSDKTWIPHKLIAAEVPTRDRGVFDECHPVYVLELREQSGTGTGDACT